MMMPSIFGENLFDSFFDDSFPFFYNDRDLKKAEKKLYGRKGDRMMKTDIREKADGYELLVDLPGFKKEEIQAVLDNGYLTISASKGLDQEDEAKESRYIRRERYAGACSRSFYVGANVEQEDIKAEFHHGVLKLFVPKKEAKAVEQKSTIAIEG
ncbi:Hsp20/alpha crystallin family protein [Oscillospiraceae bacterium Marseille-Q3528]|nr:Hsp20/alpha crystallin family protein [Oscillospiraceae bacterium Marseille-Q3528]